MENAVKLNLLENAHDFVNEALRALSRAFEEDATKLKFAVINVAQAVELLLKERLRREHPLLVRATIERATNKTVSVDVAIARLAAAGVILDAEEIRRLRTARDIRNDLMHYEVAASDDELYAAFIDLFEFAHVFHEEELHLDLHSYIDEALLGLAADCIRDFRREMIKYNDMEVAKVWPAEIVTAQSETHFTINEFQIERIRYGEPGDLLTAPAGACVDCGVRPGQFHVSGCCGESCPLCKTQWHGETCPDTDVMIPDARNLGIVPG